MPAPPHRSTLFPYTTLFRSERVDLVRLPGVHGKTDRHGVRALMEDVRVHRPRDRSRRNACERLVPNGSPVDERSEEHTSELQSRFDLVCRLLLEKTKKSERV